jgi:ACS family hexuronate transporter-like MFS transporter
VATALAFFGYNYILFFFLTWFPSYLTEAQHLSIKDMSLANVLPWFLGFVGLALSGILSDAIFRRTGKALEARKLVLTVCLGVAGLCVILAGLVHTAWSALALMSCAIFFLYLSGGTYWAILQDTVQGHQMGSVSGFIHMISNCAGIIGPSVTGLLVQGTGVFTSAFVLAWHHRSVWRLGGSDLCSAARHGSCYPDQFSRPVKNMTVRLRAVRP